MNSIIQLPFFNEVLWQRESNHNSNYVMSVLPHIMNKRPDCAFFVNGICIQTGYFSKEFCDYYEQELNK